MLVTEQKTEGWTDAGFLCVLLRCEDYSGVYTGLTVLVGRVPVL